MHAGAGNLPGAPDTGTARLRSQLFLLPRWESFGGV